MYHLSLFALKEIRNLGWTEKHRNYFCQGIKVNRDEQLLSCAFRTIIRNNQISHTSDICSFPHVMYESFSVFLSILRLAMFCSMLLGTHYFLVILSLYCRQLSHFITRNTIVCVHPVQWDSLILWIHSSQTLWLHEAPLEYIQI